MYVARAFREYGTVGRLTLHEQAMQAPTNCTCNPVVLSKQCKLQHQWGGTVIVRVHCLDLEKRQLGNKLPANPPMPTETTTAGARTGCQSIVANCKLRRSACRAAHVRLLVGSFLNMEENLIAEMSLA